MKILIRLICFLFISVAIFSCAKEAVCLIPKADFKKNNVVSLPGDVVQLTNNSLNASRYRWEIVSNSTPASYFVESGNSVFIGEAPSLVVNGLVTVKLTAANDCYDADYDSKNIGFGNQGLWTNKGNYGGLATGFKSGFSIGTNGYILGAINDFWEWDQSTNVWTQKTDYPGLGYIETVAFSIGTKGYLGTGRNGGPSYQDFYEWDQATNVWTPKSNFAGGQLTTAVAFTIGTKGYVGTGYDGTYSNSLWEYDPLLDNWTLKNPMPTSGRSGATAFSIGTKGYIGTGNVMNDFWEWDQATNNWTQIADLPGPGRNFASAFSIGSLGYVGTGGGTGATALNDFYEYSPLLNVWTQRSDFGGAARWASIGFSIGTKGYIATGGYYSTSWVYFNDLWEFDPSQ